MNKDLRRRVVTLYHELPSAGHPGISKTTTLVQRDFWWPGMGQFIVRYVKGMCNLPKEQAKHPPNYNSAHAHTTTNEHSSIFHNDIRLHNRIAAHPTRI